MFNRVETGCLLPVPAAYDVPRFTRVKVHRDFHVEVARALYSLPDQWIGQYLDARADAELVKLYARWQLVKTHPRQPPGGRSTDRGDLPAEKAGYAMRDLTALIAVCAGHGENLGIYAERLLDDRLLPTAAGAPGSQPGRFARDPGEYALPGAARLTLLRGGTNAVTPRPDPELESTP